MPARNVKIQVLLTGGLNTEQPGGILVPLDQVVQIPYLTQANNILFEEGGSFRKVGGVLRGNTLGTDFWGNVQAILPGFGGGMKFSAAGKGSDFYTIAWDGKVRGNVLDDPATPNSVISSNSSASNVFRDTSNVQITNPFEDYLVWTVAEFEGYTIFMNNSEDVAPLLIPHESSTYVSITGSEPNFSMGVVHQNRFWTAGDPDNPSRLYYSDLNDPTAGYSSNIIDIDPADGSEITALYVFRDRLFVFKGPTKGSIHVISGKTPATFSRDTFSSKIGCPGPNAVVEFADDVMFMDTTGNLRTLNATDRFGDFETAVKTDSIRSIIETALDVSELNKTVMSNDATNSRIWVQIPTGPTQIERIGLVVDYKQDVKLSIVDYIQSSHMIASRAASVGNGKTHILGLVDGITMDADIKGQERIEHPKVDGTSGDSGLEDAYTAYVELPNLKFAPVFGHNTLSNVCISTESVEKTPPASGAADPFDPSSSLTFKWQRDINEFESTTINQTFGSRLGVFTYDGSEFVLGTSRLGGPRMIETYATLETGDYRRISFAFEQAGLNEGLHVHSFAITVGADDSGSTENQ